MNAMSEATEIAEKTRRMRACDVCVGAVRMAMVLEGD